MSSGLTLRSTHGFPWTCNPFLLFGNPVPVLTAHRTTRMRASHADTSLMRDPASCPARSTRHAFPSWPVRDRPIRLRPDQSAPPSRVSSAVRCFSAMSARRACVAALGTGGAVIEPGRIQPWHTGTCAMYRLPTPTPPRL